MHSHSSNSDWLKLFPWHNLLSRASSFFLKISFLVLKFLAFNFLTLMLKSYLRELDTNIETISFCHSIFVCFSVAHDSCHCKNTSLDEDLTAAVVK